MRLSPDSPPPQSRGADFFRKRDFSLADAALSDPSRWRWISALDTGGSPAVRHPRHLRWSKIRGHTHTPAHREIMLTLQGKAVYSYGEEIYQREPGTVFLLDARERRDLQGAPWKRDFRCLWLEMHGRNRLSHYINHCDIRGRHRRVPPIGMVSGDLVELVNGAWDQSLAQPGNPAVRQLFHSAVSTLLLFVLGSPAPASANEMQQKIILSIVEYIDAHLAEKLSLKSLARLAGYSPHHFHRLFARTTGQTPVAFVNAARFRAAREMLRQGLTVEAIADTVGFSSVSYFSEFFKQQAGMAPGAWRKACSTR